MKDRITSPNRNSLRVAADWISFQPNCRRALADVPFSDHTKPLAAKRPYWAGTSMDDSDEVGLGGGI